MQITNSKLLALSAFFGSAGNSAVHVAIPWLALEATGSSAQAGMVLGLSGLSVIFTAPLIGGLIAVLGARPVSVWADIVSAASVPEASNSSSPLDFLHYFSKFISQAEVSIKRDRLGFLKL